MQILVTGGTVFASRFTAEYFAGKGHQVYVLNRGTLPQPGHVTHIKADRHALGMILKQYHFDIVLDVTAYTAADVRDLTEALGDFGQYILISSSAVYPETNPQPFHETQPCGANAIWGKYGTDKLAAEEFALSHIPHAYIIRPPYLYGPMNNLYREAFVFACAEQDLPFYLPKDGKLPLQFFHIRDLCRFLEILMEKRPDTQIFNVGNPACVTAEEWVTLCYSVLQKTPRLRYVGAEIPQRNYFPFYDYAYQLDVSQQTALMPDTAPLFEGLCESYAWYRENRALIREKPLLKFIAANFTGES